MSFTSVRLLGFGIVLLTACTACYGPDPYAYAPQQTQPYPSYPQPDYGGGYPPQSPPSLPAPSYQPPRPPAQSDYLPHLSQEYRSGWDIGSRDRQTGYPRDYRRAYERFGRGYESYFQEGYEDGFAGRAMRH
jgi:hypothetical protein